MLPLGVAHLFHATAHLSGCHSCSQIIEGPGQQGEKAANALVRQAGKGTTKPGARLACSSLIIHIPKIELPLPWRLGS